MTQVLQRTICAEDSSHIGEARRAAQALARECDMSEVEAGHAAIVATELATNLVRYAAGGLIVLQWLATLGQGTLEILSVDLGAGMRDLAACMRDGYSSGGTAGNGLGAVQRLSSEFDIFSRPGQGTVVLSRIARGPVAPVNSTCDQLRWGVRAYPIKGESINGDAWSLASNSAGSRFLVVDGLGHGPSAADAAAAVTGAFNEDPWRDPTRLIEAAHRGASGSRGAAVAVAAVDWASKQVMYAGVGNISGTLLGQGSTTGMVSHNGIVGAQVRKIQNFSYAWPESGILVMHSDGLQTRWNLDQYPGIRQHHPAIIAALLARDFSRGRDDVTVLVAARHSPLH